jgi:hypothetical protein
VPTATPIKGHEMRKSMAMRLAGFIGAAGLTAALVGSAVAGTGAYFNDTKPGTIQATLGSIKIDTANTALSFTNLLPGESQTATAQFQNTGANPQDVWIVFNQADIGDHLAGTDTNLINDHGTYGAALIKASGTPVFLSNNLNDDPGPTHCPNQAALLDPVACHGLPHMLKLVDNLGVGAPGTFEFTYTAAAKLKLAAQEDNPAFQTIHYTIVATQHGITPDDALNTTPVL